MIDLPEIIGLPPRTYLSDSLMRNTFPVLEIEPGIPSAVTNFTAFEFTNKAHDYFSILEKYEYSIKNFDGNAIKVAFIPDNFPSDTFTNEYTENFLQKMGDVASESLGQIAQMTGSRSGTRMVESLGNLMKNSSKEGGVVSGIGSTIADAAAGTRKFVNDLKNSGGQFGRAIGKMGSIADKLIGGARIDFPQLWKNSTYSPSYSFTVRLYNPKPGNSEATERFINGPIAALLLLSLPHAQEGGLYSWPYIHNIKCPGLFMMNPCYISNINIIKGGDQQQVSWNQRLGIVDIRIDFNSLFNTMLVETGSIGSMKSRPTLKNYIDALSDEREIENIYIDPQLVSSDYSFDSLRDSRGNEEMQNLKNLQSNNYGGSNVSGDYSTEPTPRTSTPVTDMYNDLKNKSGFTF